MGLNRLFYDSSATIILYTQAKKLRIYNVIKEKMLLYFVLKALLLQLNR